MVLNFRGANKTWKSSEGDTYKGMKTISMKFNGRKPPLKTPIVKRVITVYIPQPT